MSKLKTLFLILVLFFPLVHQVNAQTNTTNISTPTNLTSPVPSLQTENFAVYVLFMFGGWVRVAYNNTQVTAPLAIYVYSRNDLVRVKDNYGNSFAGVWGLAINISSLDLTRLYELYVTYKNESYYLVFTPVKSLEEEAPKPVAGFTWEQVKQWIDREAQYAAALAVVAIIAAIALKRKLLLIRTFNAVNILQLMLTGVLIWYLAPRMQHSEWLALPFVLSYVITYRVYPVGRKVYLIKIIPSLRRILWETAILYRTAEGLLAYAKQSVSEAFKRLLGKHIVLKDAELGKLGEISEEKMWKVEDLVTYESADAMLVLDAILTKERVVFEKEKPQLIVGEEVE